LVALTSQKEACLMEVETNSAALISQRERCPSEMEVPTEVKVLTEAETTIEGTIEVAKVNNGDLDQETAKDGKIALTIAEVRLEVANLGVGETNPREEATSKLLEIEVTRSQTRIFKEPPLKKSGSHVLKRHKEALQRQVPSS
jgi:hypothetical protein